MFKIGDFSRIARVSARLLRFYDEIGLFVPAHADPATGYRHYTMAQLGELNRILVLKDLGFTLEQVRDILQEKVAPAELRTLLLLRRNDAARAVAEETARLHHIESRIAQIESDGALSSDDVVLRAEPAWRLLSLRRTVPSFAAARELIGELIGELRSRSAGLLPRGTPHRLVGIAHSPQFEQDEIDVEFGWACEAGPGATPPQGSPLSWRVLEAEPRMAVCVRVGLPEDAHLVTARVGRFLAERRERLAGPGREVFLQLPDPARMHEAVVEMQFPVAPQEA